MKASATVAETPRAAEAAAVWVDVADLVPWAQNPRKNDAAVADVVRSIERFGWGAPLLARKANGEVIAGHTRLKAAIQLGLRQVPVRYLDLDPAQAHLLALADNKLGEVAEWDEAELARVLSDFSLEDAELAGWGAKELDALASSLMSAGGEGDQAEPGEDDDAEPEVHEGDEDADAEEDGEGLPPCPPDVGAHAIHLGDALEVLRGMESNSASACLCDPPYGLSFMGKAWDYDVPKKALWREVLRVLKPGAPLIAFGGSRTFHRLAVEIEDAGFELRDTCMWLFGSGFPKSLDVSKAIDGAAGAVREVLRAKSYALQNDGGYSGGLNTSKPRSESCEITAPATDAARAWSGYGTALKPAFEPAILARKPLDGTVAANVAKWGVGGLAIDASRIGDEVRFNAAAGNKPGGASYNLSRVGMPEDAEGRTVAGRWPANVILDEEAGAVLDAQSGFTKSSDAVRNNGAFKSVAKGAETARESHGHADSGGASRFFYCAKASRKEREQGCSGLPTHDAGSGALRDGGRSGLTHNHHPTVKPVALIRYLAGLILPPTPGATLLIPFSGSGSEVIGSLLAGWPSVVGIEREPAYVTIAEARLAAWKKTARGGPHD